MKPILYLFLFLTISLFSTNSTNAQVGGEGRMGNGGGYWLFGLNVGGAWQDSDVAPDFGGGWGFYLGHSLFNKPDAFFSGDLRFRFLNTYTYGQNHLDNAFGNANLSTVLNYGPDTTRFAHNYETIFYDLSLEFRLNFEKLRRKTNVWLSIYGGIGLGIYGSKFDQLDAFGLPYDYGSLDYSQSPEQVCEDIVAMQDGTYETFAQSNGLSNVFNITATPSIGIELGYWFTPSFALGIGHRTTFTLQDNFEGIKLSKGGAINSSIHHYTALMFHWRVTGTKAVKIPCPEVQFQLPTTNNQTYNTNQSSVFIKATVTNVNQNQVSYFVNSQESNNFTYNENDATFQSNLTLQEGENRIIIKGKNSCGTDGQYIIINYTPNKEPDPKQPPVVTIRNPSTSPTTVNQPTINILADILYVNDRNNVVFTINGQNSSSFSFSGTNFQANNVNLVQGQNTITVRGTNKDGTDSKTVLINYEQNVQPPVVNITNPRSNPYNTNQSTATVNATILNVVGVQNVTCTVNGQNYTNFSFSGTNFSLNNLALIQGSNTITITGRNTAGQDSKSTVIIYQPAVVVQPPVVNITYPRANPYTTQQTTENVTAQILNVDSRNDVTCTVNGQNYTNFSFSGTNFSLNNLALIQGSNTITITGRNTAGQDSKSTVIIYQPVVVEQPPVVTITTPRKSPYNTNVAVATINATILNVVGVQNVTCTVNGQNYTNFSFSGTNFSLNNLALIQGSNTITITGRNTAGQDSKSTVIIYQPAVVVQPPVVNITYPRANPYTTQQTTENVTAQILNVDSRNDVTCTVNGQNYTNFSFSGTNFSLNNLALIQGSNTITITGRNTAGQDSKSTVIIYQPVVVEQPPVVTITTPRKSPQTMEVAVATINATILNVVGVQNVTCTVNGQNNTSFSFSGTNFSLNNLALIQGSNTITITGRNTAGQDSKSTVIIYQPAVVVQPPVVNITYPRANPHNTSQTTENVIAQILNVDNRNDVTCTVNGQNNTSFFFSGTNFSLNNLALIQGSNTIIITGRNTAGQDSKTTVIIYKVPQLEPSVVITSPSPNPFTTQTATINITATILNVATKNDVTFTVNGQTNGNFSFSGTSFTANNITLVSGNNTFVITGSNSTGQASASTVVIYRPLPPPVVTFTNPNQNPFTTSTASTNISATISNVSNASGVTFSVNGQISTAFSFANNVFTANNITLNAGSNTFTITGKNTVGQDTKTTVIIHEKAIPRPIVTITSPNQNPFNTQTETVNIAATILNVAGIREVTFEANGQSMNNFSFSGTTFTANNIKLNKGSNTFTITGRNSVGQDTKSTVVVYTAPGPVPNVTIVNPMRKPFNTTANTLNMTATVNHVASASDIIFTANGQPLTGFTLTGTNFVANNVVLTTGSTTFRITGTNSAGQGFAEVLVIFTPPSPPPTIAITVPTNNPFSSTSDTIEIRATIQNIPNINGIVFRIDGVVYTNFTFSGTSLIAANIPLDGDSTTIEIKVTNPYGHATATTVILYEPTDSTMKKGSKIKGTSGDKTRDGDNKEGTPGKKGSIKKPD